MKNTTPPLTLWLFLRGLHFVLTGCVHLITFVHWTFFAN